ncbi:MAG: MarR family transcriptional regulator [Ignavibacteriaceae bacterium]|nr:MarR family transcriptional regulator [Ignavibacteriaceae bacterium]NUM70416.1 MarR family transcriptional regulator [Ignavibacteriaceae bacterium]
MSLEEEIHQKKFRNEFHKLGVNLIYTHNWLISRYSDVFKKFDITEQQFNILRILRGAHPGPLPVNSLKERMLDKMSDASRLVERLRLKGLVKRSECAEDRRKVDVMITDEGLALLKEIDKYENEFDKCFKELSESEAQTINYLLDKLRG